MLDLIEEYREELLGEKIYKQFGNQFPLLIKFIDAKQDLSIQLHPNDELAKMRHNSFGKTEMWYVIQADKNAKVIVGFKKYTDQEEYTKFLKEERLEELLNVEEIKKGDAFFIKEGTIHAIGKGALIAEIQQTSDITYRVYDWNRTDKHGKARELHTDLALDALNYGCINDIKTTYSHTENTPNEIVGCKYFTTNNLKIKGKIKRNFEQLDSFKVYMCIEGNGYLHIENIKSSSIKTGETILIPAKFNVIEIEGKNLELLEVYIK